MPTEPVVPAETVVITEPVVPAETVVPTEPVPPTNAVLSLAVSTEQLVCEVDYSPFLTDFNTAFVSDSSYLSTISRDPHPSINNSPDSSPLLITTDDNVNVVNPAQDNTEDID